MTDILTTGPADARTRLVLAHGAGAPMTSPWMEEIARLLSSSGLCVSRFEFAYMAARRAGTRKPPPKAERLIPEYERVVLEVANTLCPGQRLVIGGKSMGGRVASLVADPLFGRGLISGLACLSYPFHPPKKPGELRTAHLGALLCPTIFVQGERDPFGSRKEVDGYALPPSIRLAWMTDGDHDLAPRARAGTTGSQNLAAAAREIAAFCNKLQTR